MKKKAEILKQGIDITIIGIGKMVTRAIEVSNLLEESEQLEEIYGLSIKSIAESIKNEIFVHEKLMR